MKTNILFKILLTIFLYSFNSYAQKVFNISFVQVQSNIIISYDLVTKTPCKVSLYVSTNGGTSWQGPMKKVTGNVGDKVISGKKNIVGIMVINDESVKLLLSEQSEYKLDENNIDIQKIMNNLNRWN